jgi:hypothetical protein
MTYRRVLDWMIEFIDTTRNYRQYRAIADIHTLQFTVTRALWFSVFASRILTTDSIRLTVTSNHTRNLLCTAYFLSCRYFATANSDDSSQFNSSAAKPISRQAGVSKLG